MSSVKTRINQTLSAYEPLTIVAGTTAALAALCAAAKIAKDPQGTCNCFALLLVYLDAKPSQLCPSVTLEGGAHVVAWEVGL